MEEYYKEYYINEVNVIKDDIYEQLKKVKYSKCCHYYYLIKKPYVCLNCKKIFCKKCLVEHDKYCPNCNNCNIKKTILNNNYINIKFRCIKACGSQILFNDIKNHYISNCPSLQKKFQILTKSELNEYKAKTEKKIEHFSSKKIIIIYNYIFIVLFLGQTSGKTSLIKR
jgi:hypothetical protein